MNNSTEARKNLAREIRNGAVLIHSGNTVYRNNDTWYPFRQDSNFYYLTEWPEPGTCSHSYQRLNTRITSFCSG